ncbi:MAG: MarR family transcriptional regulator [Planctomycetes bacterium]|nr:MarR family transcriptional regulator [Planctomycetota bacterium]
MPSKKLVEAGLNPMPGVPTVQQSIQQEMPFRSLRHEAVVGLLLTVDAVRRPFQELLAQHDELTYQQYNVLRILRGAMPKGLPTLEIGTRMVERTPGVTRLIDRLANKGLVERERSTGDRRQVMCRLTPAGDALLATLDAPIADLDEAVIGVLDDGEVRGLIHVLDRMRMHVGDLKVTR